MAEDKDKKEKSDSETEKSPIEDKDIIPEQSPTPEVAAAPVAEQPPAATVAAAPTPPPTPVTDIQAPPGPPPDNGPVAGVIDVEGQKAQPFALQGPNTPEDTATYLKQQDGQFANDLTNGHIHPTSIQDLYANKGLSGKLGTLFGLLVSGMGSGLSHQSNAVMDMMNKQIQNDIDAQKQSKSNALTLIGLNQQHQLQESEKARNFAQANLTENQSNVVADSLAHMQMNRSEFHRLSKIVDQMASSAAADPTNMAKQQQLQKAQQALGMIGQGIDAQNANIADRAAAVSALLGARAEPQAGANDGGVDLKKLNDLNTLGKINSPIGLNGQESAEANKEASLIQDNRAVAKMFTNSFQKLNSLDAGHLTPGIRDTELNALQANIARSTTGMYNRAEAIAQAKGMFPEPTDLPSVRREKFKKAMEFFRTQEAATPTLDRFKLKTPFPNLSPEADPDEGKIARNKTTGERVIKQNGKWIPYKGR